MTLPIPNFCVVGAQKSGTTSLRNALRRHPDIFMSAPVKEPTFYFPHDAMVRRMRHYGYEGIHTHEDLLEKKMLDGYAGERFHILGFEDFVADQVRAVGGVFDFLGLPPGPEFPEIRSNASRPETFDETRTLPRAMLDQVRDAVIDDMALFQRITGFDVSRWDLTAYR